MAIAIVAREVASMRDRLEVLAYCAVAFGVLGGGAYLGATEGIGAEAFLWGSAYPVQLGYLGFACAVWCVVGVLAVQKAVRGFRARGAGGHTGWRNLPSTR